ncbi:MAG: hypothetical protein J2P57_23985 [Acidimicrobiaceae bacterium]|nr:hypothetical protein [Acidimicrobiaceae bacterium]
MPTFVVRVWVPDRPGALGAVASRIGAVRGDLTGIDILERGGGRAIDELVVELPDPGLVPLLVQEVGEVDGVDVEDVRTAPDRGTDARLDALETAVALVSQHSTGALLDDLVRNARVDFEADWAAVVDLSSPTPLISVGATPPGPWLSAFVAGSRAAVELSHNREGTRSEGPDDVAWAELEAAALVCVLGRRGRPWRARERKQLAVLARIVDLRWVELAQRPAATAR